jgi:hypothetical protein
LFSIEKNIGRIARCITQLRERLPKLKQQILPHRGEQKNRKSNHEKKPIKILKNRPVRFGLGFISLKQKKTKPNRKNRVKLKKLSQIGLNRFCPKNRTETGWFEPVSVRFLFIYFLRFRFGYFFL